MIYQCIVIHSRVVALTELHWTQKLVLILQYWIMVIGSMSHSQLADWYLACITFHKCLFLFVCFCFVLFFFIDFWNFPSQDIDFWYRSCKGRQCLLNIKLNTCCKKCILVFLIRHGSGKRCADREILLVLKALCGSYLLVGFATSWYKKESPAHLSALFLMRQLSASELISGEEEMEFPKLAELI